MVDRTLRNHLDYLCETWAELTDDQKLDIVLRSSIQQPRGCAHTTELMKGEADE